jgi:hypothetical protein
MKHLFNNNRAAIVYLFSLLLLLLCFADGQLFAQSPADTTEVEDLALFDSSAVTIRSRFFFNDPLMIEEEFEEESHERLFPLWKSIAKEQALPLPWTVAAWQYSSYTNYYIEEAIIGVGESPDFSLNVDSTAVDIQIATVGLRGGLWLFPFMNIYANLGYTWVYTDIYLENIPVSFTPPNPPTQPLPQITKGNVLLELDLKGSTVGTGASFAFGYHRFFTTITFSYAYSSLEARDWEAFGEQTFRTYLFLPKLGYSFEGTSIWLGARYMDDETRHTGSLEDGAFRFDVFIKQADWSPEVGINTIMGQNWELTLQAGYRDRLFTYFSVGYRL